MMKHLQLHYIYIYIYIYSYIYSYSLVHSIPEFRLRGLIFPPNGCLNSVLYYNDVFGFKRESGTR